MGGGSPAQSTRPRRQDIMQRAVRRCPVTKVKMGGVEVTCLLDTGSMVTTVTEGFFRKHICPTGDVESTSSWLKLKAANGLDIPYIGYVELDVEVLGKILPKRGILIIKDPHDPSTQARKQDIPGLLGMNVIGACKELLTQDHDVTAVEGCS